MPMSILCLINGNGNQNGNMVGIAGNNIGSFFLLPGADTRIFSNGRNCVIQSLPHPIPIPLISPTVPPGFIPHCDRFEATASSPPNNGRRRQDIILPPPPITSDRAGRNILDRGKRWSCGSPNDCHLDFGTLRAPDDDGLQR